VVVHLSVQQMEMGLRKVISLGQTLGLRDLEAAVAGLDFLLDAALLDSDNDVFTFWGDWPDFSEGVDPPDDLRGGAMHWRL